MELAVDEKVSRSKSIRRSMKEALGIKRERGRELVRKIDGLLVGYFPGLQNDASKIPDEKIQKLREKAGQDELSDFKDADIAVALVSDFADGDVDRAIDFLRVFRRAVEGLVDSYSPDVVLKGAVNRLGVTCWLDSVLFAMFARNDDFEPMLFHTFEDPAKEKLAVLIRLWVNSIRSGYLVTADITRQIQLSLQECGWKEAADRQQQDASEAFGRLTEFLLFPPLTLKRDMFHQGKADKDDHKFTHERTIDIGIPPARADGTPITLEECLETYFDETVNVSRQKEEYARRSTVGTDHSKAWEAGVKNSTLRIEIAEVETASPLTATPTTPLSAFMDKRPQLADIGRMPSIFSDRTAEGEVIVKPTRRSSLPGPKRKKSTTVGKHVSMRAFQFFRLIPWYTEGNPNTDIQVAQHFESKRPAVGICLKRFTPLNDAGSKWTKRKDYIDIPIESGIPSFLHDDDLGDEVFPNWKFKLSLQAVICHRGDTLERGHYVSFVRVARPRSDDALPMPGAENVPESGDPWVIQDDLAKPSRVRYIDIHAALRSECPYLLFYKIVLIEGQVKPGRVSFDGRPPSYTSADSTSRTRSAVSTDGSARRRQNEATTPPTPPSLTRPLSSESSDVTISKAITIPGDIAQADHPDLPTVVSSSYANGLQKGEAIRPSISSATGEATPSSSLNANKAANLEQLHELPERSRSRRSRPSSSSNRSSMSRISQIFRTQIVPTDSLEAGVSPARRGSEAPSPGSKLESSPSLGLSPPDKKRSSSHKAFRRSMDETRPSHRKDKDKEREKSSKRDQSIGNKLKIKRQDAPDRECSMM